MVSAISSDARVKVEWHYIGEGVCGDYDESDPNDVALMRFDAYVTESVPEDVLPGEDSEEPGWRRPHNYSFCTRTPYETSAEVLAEMAQLMADRLSEAIDGGFWKSEIEGLSWIQPDEKSHITENGVGGSMTERDPRLPEGYRWADGEWEVEILRDHSESKWIADGSAEGGMSLALPIQPKGDHSFIVKITGCEHRQAQQVISERFGYDEDLGFPYGISYQELP